jgi:hypothetical protein
LLDQGLGGLFRERRFYPKIKGDTPVRILHGWSKEQYVVAAYLNILKGVEEKKKFLSMGVFIYNHGLSHMESGE